MSRAWLAFWCLAGFLVAMALVPAKPGLPPNLKADEPAYYLMALSLVHDQDLLCLGEDFQRLYPEWWSRTRNLILMSDDAWDTVYFGKPYIYSLFAAPFAAVAGANGFIVFNALLLVAMIAMGVLHLRRYNNENLALLFCVGFFLLGNVFSYVFWIHPEIFNMAGIMACLYFGLDRLGEKEGARPALWRAFASGAALSFAIYNKPFYAAVALPVIGYYLLRRRWREILGWGAGLAVATGATCALAIALTGHPSAYLGVTRQAVSVVDPYGDATLIHKKQALKVQAEREAAELDCPQPGSWDWILGSWTSGWKIMNDLGLFLWGRHVGILLFTPFAGAALIFFLSGGGARSLTRWLVLAGAFTIAVAFIAKIHFNWHGGGGHVGNRYFISAYPLFLFLVSRLRPAWLVLVAWVAGGFFAGPLVFTPFGALVSHPTLQAHTRNIPFRRLPRELRLRELIPGFRGALHSEVWIEGRKDLFRPAGDELWLHGGTEVELWLYRTEPIDTMTFRLRSIVPSNGVHLWLEGDEVELNLEEGWSQVELTPQSEWKVHSSEVHETMMGPKDGSEPPKCARPEIRCLPLCSPYARWLVFTRVESWVYRMRVRTEEGAQPRWARGDRSNFYLGAAVLYMGTSEVRERDLYHGALEMAEAPERVNAGAPFEVTVQLTNRSEHDWPSTGAIAVRMSYHWRDASGVEVVRGGPRTILPQDVAAGESIDLTVAVEAPREPGLYTLQVDPVYEYVSWFSDRGVEPATASIQIDPSG